MTGETDGTADATTAVRGRRRVRPGLQHVWAAYVVAAVAALVVLRATFSELEFLGVGWIILLAVLPLAPWLLPRLGGFLKDVSPYLQSFKVAGVQIDLRTVGSAPISLPTSGGVLAALPNDVSALSSSTSIIDLVSALRELRRQGGSPVVVIDLRDGQKWRLENLYFLARLLSVERAVVELVFTETRGGVEQLLVGTIAPREFTSVVDDSVPEYAAAAARSPLPQGEDLAKDEAAQKVSDAFKEFLGALPSDSDSAGRVHRHVDVSMLVAMLGSALGVDSVADVRGTLTEDQVRTVLRSAAPFVPATRHGSLTGMIDRDVVTLAVARAALAAS